MTENYASQALREWEIARNAEIVQTLASDPLLLSRVRTMPWPTTQCAELIARADAEVSMQAILGILNETAKRKRK